MAWVYTEKYFSSNVQLNLNETDSPDSAYDKTFNVNFPEIGEYYISVELAMSSEVIELNNTAYITGGLMDGSIKNEPEMVLAYLKKIDFSGKFADCNTCNERLGSSELFRAAMIEKLSKLGFDIINPVNTNYTVWITSLYTELKNNCIALQSNCNSNPCEQYETLMLEDITPNGQYALFSDNGEPLEPELNVLFRNWRTEFPILSSTNPLYQSDIIKLENGDFTSPHASGFTLKLLIKYWKQDWAKKFLKYHPEFCKLEFCLSNSESLRWNNELEDKISKFSDISLITGGTNLVYSYANSSWLLPADPFFKAGAAGAVYYNNMQADLNEYTSKVLAGTTSNQLGLTGFVDYMLYCFNQGNSVAPFSNQSCVPLDNCRVPDREWEFYRTKYLELKEKYYKLAQDIYCNCNTCTIGVKEIGEFNINPLISDFVIRSVEDETSVCSTNTQRVGVNYLQGNAKTPLKLEIYYPGQLSPVIINFSIGQSASYLCLPAGLPISSIKVNNVSTQ